jgi:hypothetical protein
MQKKILSQLRSADHFTTRQKGNINILWVCSKYALHKTNLFIHQYTHCTSEKDKHRKATVNNQRHVLNHSDIVNTVQFIWLLNYCQHNRLVKPFVFEKGGGDCRFFKPSDMHASSLFLCATFLEFDAPEQSLITTRGLV